MKGNLLSNPASEDAKPQVTKSSETCQKARRVRRKQLCLRCSEQFRADNLPNHDVACRKKFEKAQSQTTPAGRAAGFSAELTTVKQSEPIYEDSQWDFNQQTKRARQLSLAESIKSVYLESLSRIEGQGNPEAAMGFTTAVFSFMSSYRRREEPLPFSRENVKARLQSHHRMRSYSSIIRAMLSKHRSFWQNTPTSTLELETRFRRLFPNQSYRRNVRKAWEAMREAFPEIPKAGHQTTDFEEYEAQLDREKSDADLEQFEGEPVESLSKSGKEQEEEDLKEMVREVNRKRKRTYEIEGKDPRKLRFRERSRTRIERSGGDNKNEIKEQQTKTGIFMSTEEKNKVETLAGQPKLGSPEGKDALVQAPIQALPLDGLPTNDLALRQEQSNPNIGSRKREVQTLASFPGANGKSNQSEKEEQECVILFASNDLPQKRNRVAVQKDKHLLQAAFCDECNCQLTMGNIFVECGCINAYPCNHFSEHTCKLTDFQQSGTKLYTFLRPSCKYTNHGWWPLHPNSASVSFAAFYESRSRKYTASYRFDRTIQGTFRCDQYPLLSPSQSKLVLQNRQIEDRLPLQIKQSSVGGYGVFATCEIASNTIICSYLGEIRLHTNVSWNKENDSAFEFGWINDKCVLVYTLAYANIGRFLNNEKTRPNCSIFRSMLITKSKTIEPSLVIHTIRTVHKGEELKYWYGECYGKHKGG